MMPLRFAALGDSLTEGVGDPVPDGRRGWAALLAPALSDGPVDFHNFARSGVLSRDLMSDQLPDATALRPHFAAVVAGGNDTLRAGFDIGRTARHLDSAMHALRAEGAVLLTACLPDPGRLLGLPQPLARPLARRMRAVNTVVHALSDRYGAVHLHVAELPWQEERSLLSVDRLHPSATGHHRIAREFHTRLIAHGLRLGAAPAAAAATPPPGRLADGWWMATQGTRWVAARCTDLLPGLLALAAVETRHLLRGSTAELDERSTRATASALARLHPPLAGSPGRPARRRPDMRVRSRSRSTAHLSADLPPPPVH